ncbi:flavin-containing monooxygenase FMO GS-OX-like 8 [Zingiber officinale]|uniref:flavin-containing monooxygenase FMO GS-OX-like 8 n=1 Tax=Zingiber officinale TaxID=94328 RepID=UPI001C4B7E73|nr:flavin-containing monooxygenase FMO GS-OX-like 8 [Zingiber officinale]
MEEWKRKQLHSHVYRVPEPFQDEVVVVVGGSISGPEIALELLHVAKEVHISTKHVEIPHKLVKPVSKYAHLLWHQEPDSETHLLTIQFKWNGILKSVSTSLVGVSLEFEIAIYTIFSSTESITMLF